MIILLLVNLEKKKKGKKKKKERKKVNWVACDVCVISLFDLVTLVAPRNESVSEIEIVANIQSLGRELAYFFGWSESEDHNSSLPVSKHV